MTVRRRDQPERRDLDGRDRARDATSARVAGAFGINLPSITARARVELSQITGLAPAGFRSSTRRATSRLRLGAVRRRARRRPRGFTRQRLEPDPADEDPSRRRGRPTSTDINVHERRRTTSRSSTGREQGRQAPATSRRTTRASCRHDVDIGTRSGADRLDQRLRRRHARAGEAPPLLHHFKLTPGSAGGPGFLYTASTDLRRCTWFSAEVDTGQQGAEQDHVSSSQPAAAASLRSTRLRHAAAAGTNDDVTGTITIRPERDGTGHTVHAGLHPGRPARTSVSLDADHREGRRLTKRAPRLRQQAARHVPGCSTSSRRDAGTWQQATYVADPCSSPLR